MSSTKKILVLPGDGVGQEVCDAALPVLASLGLPLEIETGDIGWEFWKAEGDPVPERTWRQIERSDAVLLGAITSKGKAQAEAELAPALQGTGLRYISPVIQLRQRLDLFANVRPSFHIRGPQKPFKLCVIRENTEGLYAGYDFKGIPDELRSVVRHGNIAAHGPDEATCTIRLQTKFGLERLFRFAFEHAAANGFARITFADKPNVMRESGEYARALFFNVAAGYPHIEADIHNVDAVALWLVTKPHTFGVIVAENMFGDILSDLAAGMMGGLGLAASANFGASKAYFEPVHGSAPRIAGQGKANPSAMVLTMALMLEHLGYGAQAADMTRAVRETVRKSRNLTYDLGGTSSTRKMADAIGAALRAEALPPQAALVTIGDELLSGRYHNTNLKDVSACLQDMGYVVRDHHVCGDRLDDIAQAVAAALGDREIVIVSGGLGPTSDDLTRFAVAQALGLELEHNEQCWQDVQRRKARFQLEATQSDKLQALLPVGSEPIPNPNGTACGFKLAANGTTVVVLPGPPKELLPMLQACLAAMPKAGPRGSSPVWTLMGALEAEICGPVDEILAGSDFAAKFVWRYPYLEVTAASDDGAAMPSDLARKLDRLLAPYCVSRTGLTARVQLPARPVIEWHSKDELIQRMLSQLPGTAGAPRLEVETQPAFNSVVQDTGYSGAMRIRVSVEGRPSYETTVPLRGPEVADYILEYSCWCCLRHLNSGEGEHVV